MTPVIGGKLDGSQVPARLLQIEEKGETYMLISFKEKIGDTVVTRSFYMLCNGPTIEQAMKTYKERAKRDLWGN